MIFIAGCAPPPVTYKSDGQNIMAREREGSFFTMPSSDADIMKEALVYLSSKEGGPNYNLARAKLALLIAQYPQSKWVLSAQNLIQTINNLLALQIKIQEEKLALDKANADKSKLVRENETIKKNYKALEERHQTETVKLQNENEQLKNNMALLKKLEIESEKREKMLK